MLHYLQGLLSALDLTSLLDAVLRVAAIFLCLTVQDRKSTRLNSSHWW